MMSLPWKIIDNSYSQLRLDVITSKNDKHDNVWNQSRNSTLWINLCFAGCSCNNADIDLIQLLFNISNTSETGVFFNPPSRSASADEKVVVKFPGPLGRKLYKTLASYLDSSASR